MLHLKVGGGGAFAKDVVNIKLKEITGGEFGVYRAPIRLL